MMQCQASEEQGKITAGGQQRLQIKRMGPVLQPAGLANGLSDAAQSQKKNLVRFFFRTSRARCLPKKPVAKISQLLD